MADDDKDSSVRDEFLAESQEIVESLSRDLLVLDQTQKDGNPDPDLINEVFRGVHTLKGIAGMFGYHQVGAVAHALEDLLDDLRLGRVELSRASRTSSGSSAKPPESRSTSIWRDTRSPSSA